MLSEYVLNTAIIQCSWVHYNWHSRHRQVANTFRRLFCCITGRNTAPTSGCSLWNISSTTISLNSLGELRYGKTWQRSRFGHQFMEICGYFNFISMLLPAKFEVVMIMEAALECVKDRDECEALVIEWMLVCCLFFWPSPRAYVPDENVSCYELDPGRWSN